MKKRLSDIELEKLEDKYLNKIEDMLNVNMNKLFKSLDEREMYRHDWESVIKKGLSDAATGFEKVFHSIYASLGDPMPLLVGSDLIYDVPDAIIHIDIKSVQLENIGDMTRTIFIGENQNSYKSNYLKYKNRKVPEKHPYDPALPTYYTDPNTGNTKPCLTYVIGLLYDRDNSNVFTLFLYCIPNGQLYDHYGDREFVPGKNPGKARIDLKDVQKFELLDNGSYRLRCPFLNEKLILHTTYEKTLALWIEIYKEELKGKHK